MLQEFSQLLEHVAAEEPRVEYMRQIIESNALEKPTRKARELTARHLMALYALDPRIVLFRVLRRLWPGDTVARPLLALMLALARDPLLRLSWDLILNKKPGEVVERGEIEAVLQAAGPDRFSPASLKSFAQNINSTWTQAGFLQGRARKIRAVPVVTPTNLSYALFLSYLEGASAQRLFSSRWARLMGRAQDELVVMANSAAQRGQIVFMNAGGVMEVRFPGYLTAIEEKWLHE